MSNFEHFFRPQNIELSPPWLVTQTNQREGDSHDMERVSYGSHSEVEEIDAPATGSVQETPRPVVRPRKSSMFAKGISGQDSFFLSLLTRFTYLVVFLIFLGGGYMLLSVLPYIWSQSMYALQYIGIPMAERSCSPAASSSMHLGDSALSASYVVVAHNQTPAVFKKAFRSGRFRTLRGTTYREFPLSEGSALVSHASQAKTGVGVISAVYPEGKEFCAALNAMGVINTEGVFSVSDDGIVSGPIKDKVWVQVSPTKGKVTTIQISAKN